MNTQDKIHNKIQKAAQQGEKQPFDAQERIWERVEKQLDNPKKKQTIFEWKPFAIAASVMVIAIVGYQFLNSDSNLETTTPDPQIVKSIENEPEESNPTQPILETDTTQKEILDELEHNAVAVQESKVSTQNNKLIPQPEVDIPVSIKETPQINDVVELEGFVTDGYGTIKETETTASVTTLVTKERAKKPISVSKGRVVIDKNAKPIKNEPNATINQMLQGKVAGLQVVSGSGQPGASKNVTIRGISSINSNNTPLYVIDGVPVKADEIGFLDTNNIESVNVLKDASSTSIYGTRGKNGIIVINTKQNLTKKEIRKLRREASKRATNKNYCRHYFLPKTINSNR